jgi:hypothetical protein
MVAPHDSGDTVVRHAPAAAIFEMKNETKLVLLLLIALLGASCAAARAGDKMKFRLNNAQGVRRCQTHQ